MVIKKNDAIYNNVDGPGGYYIWENKSDRERKLLCIMSYTGILKHKTNEWIYKNRYRLTDTENKLVVPSGDRELRGANYYYI